ncbi:MAG: coagulation factor 5/8 type protein [Gemmatimonadetes bacterium]|nr:coagulation factor 5/8 type protein [Gemmatimonadota bacterium]
MLALATLAGGAGAVTLESFDDISAYKAIPSDGVTLALRPDSGVTGSSLRMDFDFHAHAGYAVARRPFKMAALPPYWAITLYVRGSAKPNTLELKFVDSTGLNVWWMRHPDLQVTNGWTRLRFRPSDLSFAWGPLGGGPPRGIAALEIAFTAGQGGQGWLALDDMSLTPLSRPVSDKVAPRVTTTARSITFDFHGARQLGGLVLDWPATRWASNYNVETSDDGITWTSIRAVRGGGGGRRFLHLPRTETPYLRLRAETGTLSLKSWRILSDSAASSPSAFLERVAESSAPGDWPRSLTGQQQYWTVLGLPRDERDALISEDGAVESRPGSFSVEPFVYSEGKLLTWRDGVTTHSLDGGSLPIPTVTRIADSLTLEVRAYVIGQPGQSQLWIDYTVSNRSSRTRDVTLFAAIRPVQVNPPWQFLGAAGGAASIRSLAFNGHVVIVNDTDAVVSLSRPASFGATRFDSAAVIESLRRGKLPPDTIVADPSGLSEGALSWSRTLKKGQQIIQTVVLPTVGREAMRGDWGCCVASARRLWNHELDTFRVDLPADGAPLARSLRTALAHVLINARGAAIQPGTRSYRRSWIRDGALTSAALLRLGHAADVKAFIDWFAPNVFANGKVPCCVDARGADPVTENDADGEFLYLIAEYARFTHDTATVLRHWPTIARVAAHLDSLRNSRRTALYRAADSLIVFGLLPPSISHEGYSAKPAYSYWDDWWGVRGLKDASQLAVIAHDSSAAHFRMAAIEMEHDVNASVALSMTRFKRKTIPGAADLGDLDPTSSTMALEPAQALAPSLAPAMRATFDSAWATLERRRAPGSKWDVFVPYEWRDVGAFIRLGQPERARSYAQWLMTMQRPAEWNQWSEAVWRDVRMPKFIGDMPHGWVASDFIRGTLDMLAYEREADGVLVVGAGVPTEWATSPTGVTVRDIQTWWGALTLTVKGDANSVSMNVRGVRPPGGIEVHAPFGRTPRSVLVDGVPASFTHGGRAVMLRAPASIEFRY